MGCFEFLGAKRGEEAQEPVKANARKASVFKKVAHRFSRTSADSAPVTALVAAAPPGSGEDGAARAASASNTGPGANTSKAASHKATGTLEQLLEDSAKPSEIAKAYVAKGNLELSKGLTDDAVESFGFALSYSSPRTQHVAFYSLAKAKFAKAKRLSKGSRSKDREEALVLIERALKGVERLRIKDQTVDDLRVLLEEIEGLPFKVSV